MASLRRPHTLVARGISLCNISRVILKCRIEGRSALAAPERTILMPFSNEVRRLERSWTNDTAWPRRLEWIEIKGLRGWTGQRIEFQFPIVAISGENGSGKSSIIQAAASVYRDPASVTGKYY